MRQKGDAMKQSFDPSSLGNSPSFSVLYKVIMSFCVALHIFLLLIGPSRIPSVNIPGKSGRGAWDLLSGPDSYHASSDASLFSSSLPVLPHEKCM
jgi:hypothetical protein